MYWPFGRKIPQSENSRNIPNFILQNTGKQTVQTDITAGIFFLILYTVLGYLLQWINELKEVFILRVALYGFLVELSQLALKVAQ